MQTGRGLGTSKRELLHGNSKFMRITLVTLLWEDVYWGGGNTFLARWVADGKRERGEGVRKVHVGLYLTPRNEKFISPNQWNSKKDSFCERSKSKERGSPPTNKVFRPVK